MHVKVGDKFGELTVIRVENCGRINDNKVWLRCSCGASVISSEIRVLRGRALCCGNTYLHDEEELRKHWLDPIGSRSGRLVAVGNKDHVRLICQCDCGNMIVLTRSEFRCGRVKDCGCIQNGTLDLTGRRFGFWEVLHKAEPKEGSKKARWLCRCRCGSIRAVDSYALRSGLTLSCGCIKRKDLIETLKAEGMEVGSNRKSFDWVSGKDDILNEKA